MYRKDTSIFESYIHWKTHHRLLFKTSFSKTKHPLKFVLSDVCGFDKCRYFNSFLENYTHFSMVYLMKDKSEALSKVQEYKVAVSIVEFHEYNPLTAVSTVLLLSTKRFQIRATLFISDNELAFYIVWIEVMSRPSHTFLCSWYVNQNWL